MENSTNKTIYDMALEEHIGSFNVSAGRRKSPYRARKSNGENGLSAVEIYSPQQSKFFGLIKDKEKIHGRYAAIPNFGPYRAHDKGGIIVFSELEKTSEAESKSQQRFMGMVYAYKMGNLPDASEEVREAAKSISLAEAKKFAETSHKGLPEKKAGYLIPKSCDGMTSGGTVSSIIDGMVTAGKGPLHMKYFSI